MTKDFLKELKKICPKGFIDKKEELLVYSFDTSQNEEVIILPLAVVFPTNTDQISQIVKIAAKYGVSIVPRLKGTNHCGATRPTDNSIVVNFSKMDKIINIDKENLIAEVEPGVVIGDLNKELDKQGLFFAVDPSNLAVSTIGGAIALCSGGPRTYKYGNAKDWIINLTVVLADGSIVETGKNIAKNVTGYNLTSLFVGSEGTLGLISKATLKLIPKPSYRLLTLCYFDSIKQAALAATNIINSGLVPSVLDLIDKTTIETIEKFHPCNLLTEFDAALLIELDGFFECVNIENKILSKILQESDSKKIIQAKNEKENEDIWLARRSAFSALAQLKPSVVTEDIVVPKSKIVETVEFIQKLGKKYNIITAAMGHIGDGNIHPNFALDFNDPIEAENFEKLKDELFNYAIKQEGTLSAEHGIGLAKKKYLALAVDKNALELMQKIKILLDKNNIFNPKKSL